MSIIFTTGATVTFEALIRHVISVPVLRTLENLGFNHVTVQYGNHMVNGSNASKQYFSEVFTDNHVMEELGFDLTNVTNYKSITTFSNTSMVLEVFGYSPDIALHIKKADIVVSHAGTGSILDALRLHKPLLVVTNQDLMDNHQEEVASQLESEGYLYAMTTAEMEAGRLEEYLGEFMAGKLVFADLPAPPKVVESIIVEEVRRENI